MLSHLQNSDGIVHVMKMNGGDDVTNDDIALLRLLIWKQDTSKHSLSNKFLELPFGFCNSPSSFEKLVEIIIVELDGETYLICLAEIKV